MRPLAVTDSLQPTGSGWAHSRVGKVQEQHGRRPRLLRTNGSTVQHHARLVLTVPIAGSLSRTFNCCDGREQPSSILLRPTKLPEAVPDPEVTGALPSGEQRLKVRDSEPAVGTVKTSREHKPNRRERPVMAKAKTTKAEQRARAEQRLVPDAGRWNRSSAIIAVADGAAPEPAQRMSEPVQYRLAQGNR